MHVGIIAFSWVAGSAVAVPLKPATEPAWTIIANHGVTRIVATIDSQRIVIEIRTHIVKIDGEAPTEAMRRAGDGRIRCTYSHMPCSLIDALQISVGADELFVPLTAWISLNDLNRAYIASAGQERYKLVVDGGDASEGYTSTLLFDRHRILERVNIWDEGRVISERDIYPDISRAIDN